MISELEPLISKPTDWTMNIHVQVDINSPIGRVLYSLWKVGITGLPPEWELQLKDSNILKEDVVQNGDAMLDVLRFHFNGYENRFDSIPRPSLDKEEDGII